jgi:DNA-binding NtrC family response regulator
MKVLIVDDNEQDNRQLAATFPDDQVISAYNLQEAVLMMNQQPDLVILDAMFPRDLNSRAIPFLAGEFLNLSEKICDRANHAPPDVILVSSQNQAAEQFDEIVEWLDAGRVRAVLAKSLANVGWTFFQAILRRTADGLRKERESRYLDKDTEAACKSLTDLEIITNEPRMVVVWNGIRNAARTRSPLLIHAETGAGKELVARAIHKLSVLQDPPPHRSKEKPWYDWLCTNNEGEMAESALFGHVKGAFTGAISDRTGYFESASGGTFLIDEIGDMPLSTQAKLLRVLQEKKIVKLGAIDPVSIDTRVITATHRNLEELVKLGKFREDLHERISVLRIEIPPLRERRRDIPLLTDHFLKESNEKLGRNISLTADLRKAIENGPWQRNVRGLENFIRRVVTNCDGLVTLKVIKTLFTEIEIENTLGSIKVEPAMPQPPESLDQMATLLSIEIEYGPASTWRALGENESEEVTNEEKILALLRKYVKKDYTELLDLLEDTLKSRQQNAPRRIHYYIALLYLVLRQNHEAKINDFKSVLAVNSWEYLKTIGEALKEIRNSRGEYLVSLHTGLRKKKVFRLNPELI